MPTMTTSLVSAAIAALSTMFETVQSTERDALDDILAAKLAARDTLVPLYNEHNAEHKAAKENPAKAADLTHAAFNLGMVRTAKLEKLNWKHSVLTINELLTDLARHTDDRRAAFGLWCVDDQGTDNDGNPKPPAPTTFDNYMRWLRRVDALEARLDGKTAYTKAGKFTAAALALEAADDQERQTNKMRQVTNDDYVTPQGNDNLRTHIEKLQRAQHEIVRALEIIKAECFAKGNDEGRKTWTSATKAVNDAIKGK